jgi:parvulin-like peptidyl-prolyl isomerase
MTLMAAACLAGVLAGNLVCSSAPARNAIGLRCGRGRLLALCEGAGLYESDRAAAQTREQVSLPALAANLEAGRMARAEPVNRNLVSRDFDLLRAQWPAKEWPAVLRTNGLTMHSWWCSMMENWRTRAWIEAEIASGISVSAEECAAYYRAHPSVFAQPLRLRARHIFFAAPPGSPPELIEEKRRAAQEVLDCLADGQKFSDLAGSSEDEASKRRGGDLNFFAEARMPFDFWGQIASRAVGEPPALIRAGLGFHIVQVTDARPARQMSLEEVYPEIRSRVEKEKRTRAISALKERLIGMVQWNRLAAGSPDLSRPQN